MFVQFSVPGILLLLTLSFGFWLSHIGKPYHGLLFNLHKLLALGAVVLAAVQLGNTLKTVNASWLVIVLLGLAALCIVALFASGALMSMEKLDYALMLAVHRVAPGVLTLALLVIILMISKGEGV